MIDIKIPRHNKNKYAILIAAVAITALMILSASPSIVDYFNSFNIGSKTKEIESLGSWYDTDWNYRINITVNHTKAGADLTDFPMLVSVNLDETHVQADGDDILFIDNDGNKLNHEIDFYTAGTGALIAWVNVSSISGSSDTTIWLYYGNNGCANQENVAGTWDDNYGAVWHMNEGDCIDSTGNGNTGTDTSDPPVDTGIVGNSIEFVQSNAPNTGTDKISLGTGATIDTANDDTFTWEMWINGDENEADHLFITQSQVTCNYNVFFGTYDTEIATKAIKFITRDDDGTARDTLTSGIEINPGTWQYVAGTYNNGASDYKAIYIDGILKGSTATGINNLRGGATTSNWVGYGCDFGWYDGSIDEIRMSSNVRTPEYIYATYNTTSNPATFASYGAETTSNTCPVSSSESPTNKSTDVSINVGSWHVAINDADGDTTNGTIECSNGNTTSWNAQANGTRTLPLDTLDYETNYTVWLNFTDGSCDVNETYWFITEDIPPPVSSVDTISPIWYDTQPQIINVTASAVAGLLDAELWYRYSADNVSFDDWVLYDTASETIGSTTFGSESEQSQYYQPDEDMIAGSWFETPNYPNLEICNITAYVLGEDGPGAGTVNTRCGIYVYNDVDNATDLLGETEEIGLTATYNDWLTYEFSTPIALDPETNYFLVWEVDDGGGDAAAGIDYATDSHNGITLAQHYGSLPDPLDSEVGDDNIYTLYANLNYTIPMNLTFSFDFNNGSGFYEFYSRCHDNDSNYEDAPLVADAIAGYDTEDPTSSVDAITPYWFLSSPQAITVTASDTTSGIDDVELYYNYSDDNSSWDGWTSFGTDDTAPYSFNFNFPDGPGYYQFYSIATDNASKIEDPPAGNDTECGYDYNTITITEPFPVNGATGVSLTGSPLNANITNSIGLGVNVSIWSNHTGTWTEYAWYPGIDSWQQFMVDINGDDVWNYLDTSGYTASNGSQESGTFGFYGNQSVTDNYGMTWWNSRYYWSVNATDGNIWENETFYFDTDIDSTPPVTAVNMTGYGYWKNFHLMVTHGNASDTESGTNETELWYRYAADNASWGAWTFGYINSTGYGYDEPAWAFDFDTHGGTGYYQFYSRGYDNVSNYEDAPVAADYICAYETNAPVSSVDAITPYWFTTTPAVITVTASDTGGSGLNNCKLYYRYAVDNASWGAWTLYDTDSSTPYSFDFYMPDASGYYEFYSICEDNASNIEAAPGSADAMLGFDGTKPISSVTMTGYWKNFHLMVTHGTASDDLTGVFDTELWFRYAADNLSWGLWTLGYTDTTNYEDPVWTFDFDAHGGVGYYQFYSRSHDNLSNYEDAPGGADYICAYTTTTPTSNVVTWYSDYWINTPFFVKVNAANGISGLKLVELYYRYAIDNATWGAWTLYDTNNTPWEAIQFWFTFPDGAGYYQFYSLAETNASVWEVAPGSADAIRGYDITKPGSVCQDIVPYNINGAFNVTISSGDTGVIRSGVAYVQLHYAYSVDNITFGGLALFGTIYAPNATDNITFTPTAKGYYRFISWSVDYAGNTEIHGAVVTARCRVLSIVGADFTYSISGKVVSFTDASFGSITNWYWDYGDGSSDWDEKNPEHYYYGEGNYSVTLTVEDLVTHSQDSVTKTINFAVTPIAPVTYSIDFNWFEFIMPMLYIIIIITLVLVLYFLAKRSGGNRK